MEEEVPKGDSKKKLLTPTLLLIIIALSIMIFLLVADSTEPFNCGGDFDCFIATAKTCGDAKVSHTTTQFTTTTRYYYEVGASSEGCELYLRLDDISLGRDEFAIQQMRSFGLSDEEIEDFLKNSGTNLEAKEGLDGRCVFESNDLSGLLSNWKTVGFEFSNGCGIKNGVWQCETGDFKGAIRCEGELFVVD